MTWLIAFPAIAVLLARHRRRAAQHRSFRELARTIAEHVASREVAR